MVALLQRRCAEVDLGGQIVLKQNATNLVIHFGQKKYGQKFFNAMKLKLELSRAQRNSANFEPGSKKDD